jgi:asparagine synthase (glutamine-hydrolysing)
VTVSLSGDGGDELFGGYGRYLEAVSRWRSLDRVPAHLRALGSKVLGHMPRWAAACVLLKRSVSARWREPDFLQDFMRERAVVLATKSLPEFYLAMISFCERPSEMVLSALEPRTMMNQSCEWPRLQDDRMHMMFVDSGFYLPDDVLVKVDRAAMAVALETRVPFLDPDVAATAWSVPVETHFKDGRGKWLLRRLLDNYVPNDLIDRPKMGFQVPVAKWLRSELKPWADALLEPARLEREGIFNSSAVARRWREHQNGAADWSFHLWGILMFQAWQERWHRSGARIA